MCRSGLAYPDLQHEQPRRYPRLLQTFCWLLPTVFNWLLWIQKTQLVKIKVSVGYYQQRVDPYSPVWICNTSNLGDIQGCSKTLCWLLPTVFLNWRLWTQKTQPVKENSVLVNTISVGTRTCLSRSVTQAI